MDDVTRDHLDDSDTYVTEDATSPRRQYQQGPDISFQTIVIVIIGFAVVSVLLAWTNSSSKLMLKQEIYQLRGQLMLTATITSDNQTKSQQSVTVLLRDGRGQDFRVVLADALPSETFFVRPWYDEQEKLHLIPVKTIVEEQKDQDDDLIRPTALIPKTFHKKE